MLSLNYEKQLNDHYLAVMLGTEYYDSFGYGISAWGSGAATDDFAIYHSLQVIKTKEVWTATTLNNVFCHSSDRQTTNYLNIFYLQ